MLCLLWLEADVYPGCENHGCTWGSTVPGDRHLCHMAAEAFRQLLGFLSEELNVTNIGRLLGLLAFVLSCLDWAVKASIASA